MESCVREWKAYVQTHTLRRTGAMVVRGSGKSSSDGLELEQSCVLPGCTLGYVAVVVGGGWPERRPCSLCVRVRACVCARARMCVHECAAVGRLLHLHLWLRCLQCISLEIRAGFAWFSWIRTHNPHTHFLTVSIHLFPFSLFLFPLPFPLVPM